jgi:hypothetical protein
MRRQWRKQLQVERSLHGLYKWKQVPRINTSRTIHTHPSATITIRSTLIVSMLTPHPHKYILFVMSRSFASLWIGMKPWLFCATGIHHFSSWFDQDIISEVSLQCTGTEFLDDSEKSIFSIALQFQVFIISYLHGWLQTLNLSWCQKTHLHFAVGISTEDTLHRLRTREPSWYPIPVQQPKHDVHPKMPSELERFWMHFFLHCFLDLEGLQPGIGVSDARHFKWS